MKKVLCLVMALVTVLLASASCAGRTAEPDPEFILDGEVYDLVLYDLTAEQHSIVVNYNGNKVYKAARESFYLTNEEDGEPISREYTDSSGIKRTVYTVYVVFTKFSVNESREAYEKFMKEFVEGDSATLPMFCKAGETLNCKVSDAFINEIRPNRLFSFFN